MVRVVRVLAALAVAVLPWLAHAQAWPSKPVRITVPFPAGGATDVMARSIAARLQAALGQPFVVENRGGAGGVIGVNYVAKAAPDGYNLLYTASSPVSSGLKMYDRIPYDPERDLVPISLVIANTTILVAGAKAPVSTFPELVAYVKQQPGKLNLGIGVAGGLGHLVMAQMKLREKLDTTFVIYKGAAPMIVDILGGTLDLSVDNLVSNIEHIRAHKLKPLAVASYKRSELLPETPTFGELGYPYAIAETWSALMAPAGTPDAIVRRLNEEIGRIQRDPAFQADVIRQAATIKVTSPEEARAFIRSETERWGRIVADTGVKAD